MRDVETIRRDRVLVVDDEGNARQALRTILTEEGYEVAEAEDGAAALEALSAFQPDVVLCDVRMPNLDGVSLLRQARDSGFEAIFVMMTAFGTIADAVEAMRLGAEHYLTKPLDVSAALIVVQKALEKRNLRRDVVNLRERLHQQFAFSNIIGSSPELQVVYEMVRRAAPTKATVLVLGASGTGKELIAQALHEASPRADKPFVRVNCAALSESLLESELFGHEKGSFTGAAARREGRFELADGGTLFLDEIGDVSAGIQVKLLRVLQQREFERVGGTQTVRVDVRVVAATNKELEAEVKAGRFREDLFYRLNVVPITLPPLRRRKVDLPALVTHFVERFSHLHQKKVTGLAPGVLNALLAYDWPGNVRELSNVIERAVVLAPSTELTVDDMPAALRGPRPRHSNGGLIPGATMHDIEREAILQTLEVVGGSTSKAAEMLGLSVRTIQYRLKQYGDSRGQTS
jgi:two-component system, NtrC family, response regulator